MPQQPDPYFAQLSFVDHSLTTALVGTEVVGAALLWRRRRAAFRLFIAALFLSIVGFWWQILMRGWVGAVDRMVPAMTTTLVVSLVLGPALLLGVCIYVWRLTRAGVLR
jgi:hypothetical protein